MGSVVIRDSVINREGQPARWVQCLAERIQITETGNQMDSVVSRENLNNREKATRWIQ